MSWEWWAQSLLQNKHGFCPIWPCQMESMSEVVFPPEEGIEIVRDEQDLPYVESQRDGVIKIGVGTSCINP